MIDFETAKAVREVLRAENQKYSDKLNEFPRGEMGLTPDHVKRDPEFKAARAGFARTHNALRNINRFIKKHYKREHYADAMAEREGRA